MTPELRARAEQVLGYTFADDRLLKGALTHASVADNRLHSNERMEFLGDSVLDLVVVEELYRTFPTLEEGDLTKIKSAVVSRQTCAAVARETGMDKLLMAGKGISGKAALPHNVAAAVYESIVAAVYLDGGFEPAKKFVLATMGPKVKAIAATLHQLNYKAALQQFAQRELGGTPQYELLDEKGPDHGKAFEVGLSINGRQFNTAWGTNKKVAEQKAALLALEELKVLSEDEVTEALERLVAVESSYEG